MPFRPMRSLVAKANLGSGPIREPARSCPFPIAIGHTRTIPQQIGITPWEMTRHFGGRTPGGNMGGNTEDDSEQTPRRTGQQVKQPTVEQPTIETVALAVERSAGDRLHGLSRRFAEPTTSMPAAIRSPTRTLPGRRRLQFDLGTIDGEVSRIKEGSDPNDEATKEKLPKVTYDASRFGRDGTVFMDLIREPSSNACYQCHSNRIVSDSGIEQRWIHDEDVHLRAGMACADCHRNGIDHHIVRGFDGEQNPSGQDVETLSCSGCHLGTDHDGGEVSEDLLAAGRPTRFTQADACGASADPLREDFLHGLSRRARSA